MEAEEPKIPILVDVYWSEATTPQSIARAIRVGEFEKLLQIERDKNPSVKMETENPKLFDQFLTDPAAYYEALLAKIKTCDIDYDVCEEYELGVVCGLCRIPNDNITEKYYRKIILAAIDSYGKELANNLMKYICKRCIPISFYGHYPGTHLTHPIKIALLIIDKCDLTIVSRSHGRTLLYQLCRGFACDHYAGYSKELGLAIISRCNPSITNKNGKTALDELLSPSFITPAAIPHVKELIFAMIAKISDPMQSILSAYQKTENDINSKHAIEEHKKHELSLIYTPAERHTFGKYSNRECCKFYGDMLLEVAVTVMYKNHGDIGKSTESITEETRRLVTEKYEEYKRDRKIMRRTT